MLGWDFEFNASSRFWNCDMFKICELWTVILWYELNPRVRCAFGKVYICRSLTGLITAIRGFKHLLSSLFASTFALEAISSINIIIINVHQIIINVYYKLYKLHLMQVLSCTSVKAAAIMAWQQENQFDSRLNQDLLDLRKCWNASIKIHKWEIVQTLALSQPEVIPDDVWQEDYDYGNNNDYGHGNHSEVIVET